jgi:hypothetical protein
MQNIEDKHAKLAGYRQFPMNWLSIYDNLPLPNVNLADAMAHLAPKIASLWNRKPCFDAVFIERGPVIVELTPSRNVHHVLEDLW